MNAVEPPSNPVPPLVLGGLKTRFNSATARLAVQARDAKRAQAVAAIAAGPPIDTFTGEQRTLLRARLDHVGRLIDAETDPASLDRLAAAWSKLAEQERILDGRPLPGSRRPIADRPERKVLPPPE